MRSIYFRFLASMQVLQLQNSATPLLDHAAVTSKENKLLVWLLFIHLTVHRNINIKIKLTILDIYS